MKIKVLLPMVLLILCFQQVIVAQTLNKKVIKSLVEFGNTFPEIPKERLSHLDQLGFTIYKRIKDDGRLDVVFIDKGNQEASQLAMVWLETGLLYYGHQTLFNVQSAGLKAEIKPISGLASLNDFGFRVRNTRGEHPMSYNIKYGSDSWVVYPKSLERMNLTEDAVKIYVEEITDDPTEGNKMELLFSDRETIPREILYLATRIDNQLKS